MKISTYIAIGLLTAVFIISIGFYAFTFNGGISTEPNNWIAFGNYFAGIAALLNVVVFVWLTISIQKANEKSREADRKKQKEIILSQLRYDELTRLTALLDEVTQIQPGIFSHGKVSHISFTVNSFFQSRKTLFPILDSPNVAKKFIVLCKTLNNIAKILRDAAGLDGNGFPIGSAKPLPREFNEQLAVFQNLRVELIPILESFILSSLT